MKTTDIEDIFTVYQTGFHRYISECTPSDYIILIITLAYDFFHQIRQSALDDPENKVMHEVKCLLIIDLASILIAQRFVRYVRTIPVRILKIYYSNLILQRLNRTQFIVT